MIHVRERFDEHDHTLSQISLRPVMQTELLHSTGQQHDQYILICDADQETVRTILIWTFLSCVS